MDNVLHSKPRMVIPNLKSKLIETDLKQTNWNENTCETMSMTVMLCGPSQSGKSFLCQQMLSAAPVSPEEAMRSNSFSIGNGIDSKTKVLEMRSLSSFTIIDTVGFPDMDARSPETNCAVYNLALAMTIGIGAYKAAINAYGKVLTDEGLSRAEAAANLAKLVQVGERAEASGIMGNIDAIVFVIPCNNAKLTRKGGTARMENFWAMCGGWRILGHNVKGTLAICNDHQVTNFNWTVDIANRFAEKFWFSPNDCYAKASGYNELYRVAKNDVPNLLKRINSKSPNRKTHRLIHPSEFPEIQSVLSKELAQGKGDQVTPWCGQSMGYGHGSTLLSDIK